jgi:hypothetical protein
MRGFVRAERQPPQPLRVGSRIVETRKMMGHEATEVFEVTAIDPPRSIDLYVDGTKGSMRSGWFKFRHTVTSVERGSLLVLSGEAGGQTGCMAFLGKLMMRPMKRSVACDLAALKVWVETGTRTVYH